MQKHVTRRLLLSATILGSAGIAVGSLIGNLDAGRTPSVNDTRLLSIKSFEDLCSFSKILAQEDFVSARKTRSDSLRKMAPEQFAQIRFNPSSALWRNQGKYEAQFFAPGVYATDIIDILELPKTTAGFPSPVQYHGTMFTSSDGRNSEALSTIDGIAGLKLLYPFDPEKSWKDELIVFLGASYFRFLGKNQQYGLSARGIAVNTALSTDEEFPLFRAFWIKQPSLNTDKCEIWALLDGPSICGAYRFIITPGEETEVDIQATITLRKPVEKLGIAPLTSMFLNGENERKSNPRQFSEHIHDSDGMMIALGSEENVVWRPLAKRQGVVVTQHFDKNPRGFGFLQRFQKVDAFATPEKRYHMRPGYWIEPKDPWGEGHVQLVEIASDDVDFDNLALFWVPKTTPEPHVSFDLKYKITSLRGLPYSHPNFGIVKSGTVKRIDSGTNTPYLKVEISFADIPARFTDSNLTADVSSFHGDPQSIRLRSGPSGDLILSFEMRSHDPQRADMRATILNRTNPVSETWSYLWTA